MKNKQRITLPLARKIRGNTVEEDACPHRRQIALHGPTGLTMRCEVCGAVLTCPHKLWGSVGRMRPSGAQRRLK